MSVRYRRAVPPVRGVRESDMGPMLVAYRHNDAKLPGMADSQVLTRTQRERRSAAIREWAALNWDETLSPRGRLPDVVVEAYYAAQGIPTGPPDGEADESPDVSRETSGDASAPEDDVSRETSGDAEEEVPEDPAPSRPRSGRGRRRAGKATGSKKKTPPVVTPQMRKDIRGKLALLALPVFLFAEVKDPLCGGALSEQNDELLDWTVDLICDSADLVEFFTAAEEYGRWLKLAGILSPIASVAFRHHITHSLGDDAEQAGGEHGPVYTPSYSAVPPDLYVAARTV